MASHQQALASLRVNYDAIKAASDWGASLSGSGSGTPGSAAAGARPHASLLATPVSRHAGGKLTQRPSPSILSHYERVLEEEAGVSPRSRAAPPPPPPPASRFTPHDPLQPPHPAAQRPLAGLAAGLGGVASPARKPSLLEQALAGRRLTPAAGKAGGSDPLAPYRASPAAAAQPGSDLQADLRHMQALCSRTAAQNSAAAAASSAGVVASPLRPAASQRPSQAPLQQPQQQQDFRIPAAFPGSALEAARGSYAGASTARSSRHGGYGEPPQPAPAAAEGSSSGPLGVSLRLTPLFDAASDQGGSRQRSLQASPRAAPPVGGAAGWPADCSPRHQASPRQPQPAHDQPPSTAFLASRVNALEVEVGAGVPCMALLCCGACAFNAVCRRAKRWLSSPALPLQLRLERMRAQDAAAEKADMRQQLEGLRQQAQRQSGAADAAQARAAQAEARAEEATQQVRTGHAVAADCSAGLPAGSSLRVVHLLQAAALQEEVQRRQSVHSESMDSLARLTVS